MSRHRAPTTLLVAAVLAAAAATTGCAAPTAEGAAGPVGAVVRPAASPQTGPDAGSAAPPATPSSPRATDRTMPANPAPARSLPPVPSPTPSLAAPTEAFAMDLYRPGDYVRQYTFEWCVGASIQMTLNIVGSSDDRSRARQQELWELARDLSNSPFGGASPIGWTEALNRVDVGPYRLVSVPDLDGALRTAAAALRETNRPVGLVMWSGRHAWVMSGFEALGDPATARNFRVTGVRVLDPLHPHGSRRWGPSPEPNALLTPEVVGRQFVARLGGRVPLGVAPGYLLILPVSAA